MSVHEPLTIRQPAVARTVIGIGLIGIGLLVGWAVDAGHLKDPETGRALATWQAVLFGSIPVALGVAVGAFRSGITIDPRHNRVVTWSGPLFPLFSNEHELGDSRRVTVSREVRGGNSSNSSSKTVYPVKLVFDAGEDIELAAETRPDRSRRLAERVARCAQLPMRNQMTDDVVDRQPHQLDWSLRQHLLADGDPPPLPTAPDGSTVKTQAAADDPTARAIELPPIGLARSGLVLALPALPMLAFPFLFFGGDSGPSPLFLAGVIGIVAVPILGVMVWAANRALTRTTLQVSPRELEIRRRGPLWRRTRRYSADDIEALSVESPSDHPLAGLVASGGLHIVTDERVEDVGRGCSAADLEYAADLIRHVVCH
ncbi:MAG: hypothetical protein R3336_00565 [Phycisphaeraceae bacterium]|nr:hypothetical protein [Phycisphaeraceae bacterium]